MSTKIGHDEVATAIDELAEQHEEQALEALDDAFMLCDSSGSSCNNSCTGPVAS